MKIDVLQLKHDDLRNNYIEKVFEWL